MGHIIELAAITEIKREISQLKKSLEECVIERDELCFVVCENIKTAYMLEIGSLEYRNYKLYCDYLRLHWKKELIQAKKNRQETVIMESIEAFLDEEFISYQKRLDEKMRDINDALERSKMEALSEEETVEFKKLYRSIVKSLHPDLNPDSSEGEKQLFLYATAAYRQGDLVTLQLIFQIIGDEDSDEYSGKLSKAKVPSSFDALQSEKIRIQHLIDQVQMEIDTIKTTAPYIWKIYFEDENKKAEKIDELERERKSFQQAIRAQEEQINNLLKNLERKNP